MKDSAGNGRLLLLISLPRRFRGMNVRSLNMIFSNFCSHRTETGHKPSSLQSRSSLSSFSQVAASSLESTLLKYSAREYLFRASLCQMCIDMMEAQRAIEKYNQMLPAFEDSREYTLLKVSSTIGLSRISTFSILLFKSLKLS